MILDNVSIEKIKRIDKDLIAVLRRVTIETLRYNALTTLWKLILFFY